MITNIKTSLMGPLAAIGDSLFFNCIRVISGGIGIALASQGNPWASCCSWPFTAVCFWH